jgi:hypothetical protein
MKKNGKIRYRLSRVILTLNLKKPDKKITMYDNEAAAES